MRARAGLIGSLAIAMSVRFDAVSFDLQGKAGPNDQMFISRIKITKN